MVVIRAYSAREMKPPFFHIAHVAACGESMRETTDLFRFYHAVADADVRLNILRRIGGRFDFLA